MKIVKAICNDFGGAKSYYVMFDEIPKKTYRKVGADYVGTCKDKDGNILFSHYLKKGSSGAFAGSTLTLDMEDGSKQEIKDYWWDAGPYSEHGEFISIGAATLEDLQKCYVYFSMYISVPLFQNLLDEYLKTNNFEKYDDVKAYVDMQYDWYQVKINGKNLPLLVNINGNFIRSDTLERVYCRRNLCKVKSLPDGNTKHFDLKLFKCSYMKNGRKITVEANFNKVLEESIVGKPKFERQSFA